MPLDWFPFLVKYWVLNLGYINTYVNDTLKKKFKKAVYKKEAIKTAIRRVKRGESMLIFPEGKIEKDNKIKKFHTGAVRIAISAKVPKIVSFKFIRSALAFVLTTSLSSIICH